MGEKGKHILSTTLKPAGDVTAGKPALQWVVYLLRCRDGSLYCGCTNNIEKRFLMHQSGKGAKYTKKKGAVRVELTLPCADRIEASRLEYKVKQLSKAAKERLVLEHLRQPQTQSETPGVMLPAINSPNF